MTNAGKKMLLDPTIITDRATSKKNKVQDIAKGLVTLLKNSTQNTVARQKEIVTSDLPPLPSQSAVTDSTTTDMSKSSQDSHVASTPDEDESRSRTSSRVRQKILFPYDYNQVIGNEKSKFLEEGTFVLSLNGARDVECSDVSPGSIILELCGSRPGVAAAVRDLLAYSLKLPSFPKIKAMDPGADHPIRDTDPQPRNRATASNTTSITQSLQTSVTDTQLKEVRLVTNADEQVLRNPDFPTIVTSRKGDQSVAVGHVKRRSSARKGKKVPRVIQKTMYVKFSQC